MVRPFLWGVGGKIASGEQWMSWVTLQDIVAILRFALENGAARGAIHVVSPQPVRNAEFTKVLAKTLRRPALFPTPAFALRLLLGEMADELLLSSQRAMPAALEKLGYRFLHPDLPSALAAVFGTA
jgi:NAD dependent epimerase/dehydratase family enzyme